MGLQGTRIYDMDGTTPFGTGNPVPVSFPSDPFTVTIDTSVIVQTKEVPLKAFTSTVLSLTASAVAIPCSGVEIQIVNFGANTCYLGGNALTTTTGYPLYPQDTARINVNTGTIYAICGTTTGSELRILQGNY